MTDDTPHTLGDAPIEEKHRELMNHLAKAMDEILNPGTTGDNRKNGFVLLVFPFDDHGGRCNYISNANREDMLVMLKEQVKRFEGQPETVGRA